MGVSLGIFILIALALWLLYVNLSEVDAKLDIVLTQCKPDWELYFNDDIHHYISEGQPAKAAMELRKQTGLSFKYCLKVIESLSEKSSN